MALWKCPDPLQVPGSKETLEYIGQDSQSGLCGEGRGFTSYRCSPQQASLVIVDVKGTAVVGAHARSRGNGAFTAVRHNIERFCLMNMLRNENVFRTCAQHWVTCKKLALPWTPSHARRPRHIFLSQIPIGTTETLCLTWPSNYKQRAASGFLGKINQTARTTGLDVPNSLPHPYWSIPSHRLVVGGRIRKHFLTVPATSECHVAASIRTCQPQNYCTVLCA